jgi:hypothetical protein
MSLLCSDEMVGPSLVRAVSLALNGVGYCCSIWLSRLILAFYIDSLVIFQSFGRRLHFNTREAYGAVQCGLFVRIPAI